MAYAEVNGIKLYYEERGEGRPLLMIMGLAGNTDWWEPEFLALLAENIHIVILDNRGAGRSDKPREGYSVESMASDAAGLLRSLGIGRADVLGVSVGGKIAQELALAEPGLVGRLVLCCTNCGGSEQVTAPPEVYAQVGARRPGATLEDVARSSLPLIYPDAFVRDNPEMMEDFIRRYMIAPTPAHAFFAQLEAAAAYDSFDRLPEIKAPALVLTGDSDELVPPENARILADNIPSARLITYEGGGHFFFSQFPRRVAADVTALSCAKDRPAITASRQI